MMITNKKAEGNRKCVIKWEITSKNYTDCLYNNKNVYRSQNRFKSYNHDVYTDSIKCYDGKRLQTHDKITTYPYGTNAFKVCESEMLEVKIVK